LSRQILWAGRTLGDHRVDSLLAACSFSFAAANDLKREEQPRHDPENRLYDCWVHRFVLLPSSVFVLCLFAQRWFQRQPPNSNPGELLRSHAGKPV
jgi:hypothetical protein